MFQYAIDMDLSRPVALAAETVSLACMFRHFNRAPITFGEQADGAEQPLRLGYKLFRSREQTLVHEGRLKPKSPLARPEQWLPFELSLPSKLLSGEEEFEILVDLVTDDEIWFHERGHHGNRFRVNFVDDGSGHGSQAAAAALPEAPAIAHPAAVGGRQGAGLPFRDRVGAPLADMLGSYDFSGHAAIARLARKDAAATPRAAKLPDEVLAVFNRPSPISHDSRFALTALMEYFMLIRREDVDRLIGKRQGRFDLIRRFFEISHQLTGEPAHYFPRDLVAELNAFVLSDGLFEMPLSRLMLWHWLGENRPLTPDMSDEREAIYWWWVTGAMPANRIPDVFVPPAVAAHLSAGHESFRGRLIELPRFACRAWRESEQMQQRYDLNTAGGLVGYSFDVLIHSAGNRINRHFIGSSARGYWSEPVEIAGLSFTRFELALAGQIPALRSLVTDGCEPATAAAARRYLDETLPLGAPDWLPFSLAEARAVRPMPSAAQDIRMPEPGRLAAKPPAAEAPRQEAMIVAGLLGSPSGLGVNLKMSCQTFQSMGASLAVYDTTRRRMVSPEAAAKASATLFHVNADMVAEVLATDPTGELARRRRIGFFLWELDVLPKSHVFGAELVDEIWAPSQFVAEVYAAATNREVKLVKKFITMPDLGPAPPRPEGPFSFLTSFDFHSGVERKNPFAVVRAFQDAFPHHDRDVTLTVKTTEYVHGHWGDANNQWQLIQEAAARDPRITIIVDALPEREFFGLIRSHDCVVSSHRAEGFGYLPAYAMSFRKPVIVTDYSGTTDFCTDETAYPVSHRLVPVRPREFISEVPGARWAEIDHDHLVAAMREVRADRAGAARRAARAARLIAGEYALRAQAERYREALEWNAA
jgi:glycosyltransferase involved in cell wall biosynthesis